MTRAKQLINEAVFCEIGQHRWPKGLWDNLKSYIPEIEQSFNLAITYQADFPNSPDARNSVRALSTILDSVSESYKSMELLKIWSEK